MNNLTYKKTLEVQTIENIKNSKSLNTNRAYKADYNDFINFCKSNGFEYSNAEIKTISLYLTDLSNRSFKYSTIRRRLASLSLVNKLSGNYIDIKHPLINENLKSIIRKIGSYQKGKSPIILEDLHKIIREIDKNRSNLRKIRDKSIILLGFSGGFRRSEIVSLNIENVEFVNEGMKIFLQKSKTDQFGQGFLKGIPYFNDQSICSVKSIIKWINILNKKKGPLFRKISKSEKILDNRLTDQTVALILKKYIEKAGLNSSNFSGHSLRVGFATVAASFGADERSIMNMTGHKSATMVRRYIREANLFKNNALNKIIKI